MFEGAVLEGFFMSKAMVGRISAALTLLVASGAYAGGYELPENTTRALGRAGANIAAVEDASATYLNPAGLASVRGFAFSGSLNFPLAFNRLHRSPFEYNGQNNYQPFRIEYEQERNKLSAMPAPMIFFSHDFGLPNTTFGFAAYGPSSTPQMKWGSVSSSNLAPDIFEPVVTHRGSTAYQMVNANLIVAYPSLSVAHKFENIGLSIGGAIQLAYGSTDVTVGLEGTTGTRTLDDAVVRTPDNPQGVLFSEDPAAYIESRVRTTGIGVTANFGVRYEPSEAWAIGLSYRPAHTIKMKGTFEILETPGLQALELRLVDDKASMDIVMPHVLRGGVNYRHIVNGFEVFDIELAATYEMWSIVDEMVAHTPGPIESGAGAIPRRTVTDVAIPFYFNNQVSLRLGGDYNGLRDPSTGRGLGLRGGLFWESNGSPSEYSNIFFMPFQRIGIAAGLSYYFDRISIDFGAMWTHGFSRTVDDGEFNVLNPLWVCLDNNSIPTVDPSVVEATCAANGDASPYHAVNNGTYKSDYLSLSLGLTWNW